MPLVPSQTKLIRVGHSPDPDDAFMFYALAKEKIPMRGFRVEHVIEDIESLNQRALRAELEVTAVSCHAYAYMADQYLVMRSGASVGDNYGPILVARKAVTSNKRQVTRDKQEMTGGKLVSCPLSPVPSIAGKRIAVPGKLTTAYLALQLFDIEGRGAVTAPSSRRGNPAPTFEPVFLPFDQILGAVKTGKVDLGLIIHEGQITYAEAGLEKVVDLGAWWHEKYHLPLPLGIDVIRRDLGRETIRSFSALFKESIEYALAHRKPALDYAIQFGRGIAENLNDRFVAMYVNDFTVDLGARGEGGLGRLFEEGFRQGLLPRKLNLEFV